MDPEGMVALLNYREDGVTRMSIDTCISQRLINDLVRSILRLLEGWPQGGKALVFLLHLAPTAMAI